MSPRALRTPSRQRIVRRLERRLSHRLDARRQRAEPSRGDQRVRGDDPIGFSARRIITRRLHRIPVLALSVPSSYAAPHLKNRGDAARVIHPSKHQDVRFPRISPASRPRVHSTHIAERSNRRRGRGRGARDRGHGRVGATRRARARPSSSITVTAMGVIVNARRRRRARERREGDEERARETDDDDASSASTRDG